MWETFRPLVSFDFVCHRDCCGLPKGRFPYSKVWWMKRVRLPEKKRVRVWEPEWSGPFIGWTKAYIRQNRWRLEPGLYDDDDLMQEGYVKFLHMVNTYPLVVEPAHFMALYKTAFRNLFWDLSRKNRDRNQANEQGLSILYGLDEQLDLSTEIMLAEAPVEVRLLLSAFEDEEILAELQKPQRENNFQPREGLNARICRLMGFDPEEVNLVLTAKNWLKANQQGR